MGAKLVLDMEMCSLDPLQGMGPCSAAKIACMRSCPSQRNPYTTIEGEEGPRAQWVWPDWELL